MYTLNIFKKNLGNAKWHFIFLILLSTIISILNALSAISIIPIVSIFLNQDSKSTILEFIKNSLNLNIQKDEQFIIYFIIFFVSASLLKIFNDYLIIKIRTKILSNYFYDILNSFFKSDWHFFYLNDIGKISNSIFKEQEKIGGAIIAAINLISNFFLILILLFVPIFISAKFTILMILIVSICSIPLKFLNNIFYNIGLKNSKEQARFSSFFIYSSNMYKNISANCANNTIITNIFDSFKKINKFLIQNKVISSSVTETINSFTIFFLIILFVISKYFQISIPELTAIVFSLLRIFPYANNSLNMIYAITSAKPAYEILEELKDSGKKHFTNWGNIDFKSVKSSIKLENIGFKFPNGNVALSDINMEVESGKMIALFGESGSGKSTILDLFAGLNKPTQGKILIDGLEMNAYNKMQYLNKVGYVDNNVDLFPISLKDNIKLFSTDSLSKNDLDEIYDFSNLRNLIEKLKLKDETIILEKGSSLSTGQKQRICIARAYAKKPQIFILDEITSNLDENNEIEIITKLKKIKEGKIIICSTHKKNLLQFFDEIYFLNQGKIIKHEKNKNR